MSYISVPFLLTLHWGLGLPALSRLEALVQAARKRCHAAVELQAQQPRGNLLGRKSGSRAERVHVHRIVAHVLEQARLPRCRSPVGRGVARRRYGRGKAAWPEARELREYVFCRL